jgi:hypothetical protein
MKGPCEIHKCCGAYGTKEACKQYEGQSKGCHEEKTFKNPQAGSEAEGDPTKLTVNERLDQAEQEILKVCRKFNIDLSPKYDDGVAVVMVATEKTDGGKICHEREIET